MDELMLRVDNVSKQYVLGQIGGTTLRDELQRWSARMHGREDPTKKIGTRNYTAGETFLALDGVSFDVKKGERVGIIGRNGAGKSTLLKLISRVTVPTRGRIGLNGRVASMLEVGTGFHGELTGRENIYMNGAILGMKKKEIDDKVEDIIDFSECRRFIDTPVKRYSSGMYVELAFAVAAHLDAEIMVMDEVLAVGDMTFQKKCLEKMSDVSKAEGRTILYVSHNMNTIRHLCERCIVLDHGKVIFDGDVEKGIRTYLGTKINNQKRIILKHLTRDPEFYPHTVTMSEIECVEEGDNTFPIGSVIRMRLICESDRDIKDAFLRVIIKNAEGRPVTMITTNEGFDLSSKEVNNLIFQLDISRLVPGKYTVSPVVYEVNHLGMNVNLDGLRDIYGFEIYPTPGFNHNMIWQPRYWGYFYNHPIKIEKEENHGSDQTIY